MNKDINLDFDLSKISHLIFDWDGTVMDSAHKIVMCMQKAAIASSLDIPSPHEVHQIIGMSLVPAIERLFAVSREKAEEVKRHYKEVFLSLDAIPCPLFPGAAESLALLSKQYTLGVATGKARRGLERALASTNTGHFFSKTMTADDALSKPSPDMLEKLLDAWQIDPSSALMVGDTHFDMYMAEQINMPRIGVSYGVHSYDQLLVHAPLTIVDSFSDLHALLVKRK